MEMCVVSSLSCGHSNVVGDDFEARVALIVLRRSVAYSFEVSRASGMSVIEIGIAEVVRAIRVGALHRLGHQVDRVSGPTAHLRDVVALEDVEHLDDRDAAGADRRHGDHFVAAVGALDRHALLAA